MEVRGTLMATMALTLYLTLNPHPLPCSSAASLIKRGAYFPSPRIWAGLVTCFDNIPWWKGWCDSSEVRLPGVFCVSACSLRPLTLPCELSWPFGWRMRDHMKPSQLSQPRPQAWKEPCMTSKAAQLTHRRL